MATVAKCSQPTVKRLLTGRRRHTAQWFAGIALAIASVFGASVPAVAATSPTLAVVVIGSGSVTSAPVGIACPGKCSAPFAAGTKVILTEKPKGSATFLRWGGSCTGTGTCAVKVSTLSVVAAQFAAGTSATPPTTGKYVAQPGPYAGPAGQGWGLSFFVAHGGSTLVNLSIPTVSADCKPAGNTATPVVVPSIPIKPSGNFTSTNTEKVVLNGSPGKVTWKFEGHFMAATSTAQASAAGTWSEDIAFSSGSEVSCTTNEVSWTATGTREPAWTKANIKAGSYAGQAGQGWGLTFTVPAGGAKLLNVSIPTLEDSCVPSGDFVTPISIPSLPVKPTGPFTATSTQHGVLNNTNAKITITFSGYFEGPTSSSVSTVAGMWREDVVFSGGSVSNCTTGNVAWSATLQP